jgi:deazaflavin-dependent oxidoreductase (nitroreductase family)
MTETADREAILAALSRGGVIDITTTGRRSGRPRRLEIVFFAIDRGIYISGMPGRRGWLANLSADPRLTVHLKGRVRADLPATARIVTDEAERRRLLEHITAQWRRQGQLEAFVDRAPLIEVRFDDPSLVPA